MSAWTEIIDDLVGHIGLMKELGVRTVELDAKVLPEWDRVAAVVAQPSATTPSQHTLSVETSAPKVSSWQAPKPAEMKVDARALSRQERDAALTDIAARIAVCEACGLCKSRTKIVPGQGNPESPDVMFIGEAPGAQEDEQGLAFVGAAGQLLTKMIAAMGYAREDIFIGNICKCRPPNNRTPTMEEMQKCLPFLREQIAIIKPKTIVLLGNTAIKGLLENQAGVTRLQGQWTVYNGIPVMPTYHPAYLLRFESSGDAEGLRAAKMQVWRALKLVLAQLGKPVPK